MNVFIMFIRFLLGHMLLISAVHNNIIRLGKNKSIIFTFNPRLYLTWFELFDLDQMDQIFTDWFYNLLYLITIHRYTFITKV